MLIDCTQLQIEKEKKIIYISKSILCIILTKV